MKTLAALCLALVTGTAWAAEKKVAPISVPFELLETRHIVVSVKINGKGPYRVIFDTGAPFNLLNNRTARASGMVDKNSQLPLLPFLATGGPTRIRTLELGGVKVEDAQAIVMDHPTVELMSKLVSPVEGIIGFPFFARFRMTLDYQARRLTFIPSTYDPGDPFESLMNALTSAADDQAPARRILSPAGQWGIKLRAGDKGTPGVVIDAVSAGSAAAAAGLKVGDRVLTLDDRWTDSIADFFAAAGDAKAGTPVAVHVKRGDQELDLSVTPRNGL